MTILELGCGIHPAIPDAIHHDRIKYGLWIDVAHDLDVLPWPWKDAEFDKVVALDVMEHLRLDINMWLDECWRILKSGGELILSVPSWDGPYAWCDPTHQRAFQLQTFDYWDKSKQYYRDYGSLYFRESDRWWMVVQAERVDYNLNFILRKVTE